MSTRLARTARLLIAILAVYGFVLHGFGRDAAALVRMTPQAQVLCLPGSETAPDHDAGRACDLHCTGALAVGNLPCGTPAIRLLRLAIPADVRPVHPTAGSLRPLRLAEARGPPHLI